MEICSELPWDSRFWGFAIARYNGEELDQKDARTTLNWCDKRSIRCLYLAANGACETTLRQAWAAGFRFVDVRVEMELVGPKREAQKDESGLCREANLQDLPDLQGLARDLHVTTRFFKDANFDRSKAADLYALWIEKDLHNHQVFVARSPNDQRGVLGYISATGDGRISLLGVARESQGSGIGRGLMKHALHWFTATGIEKVRVVTQATNINALRFYENHGFRVVDTKIWFHRWFDS